MSAEDAGRTRRHPARPVLHFTPPANWMNDPNGLVRVDDVYHLFYQHNPAGTDHANLHWGHATSRDLFSWSHLQVALSPDELGEIYSGTAAIDATDTAGFGPGALVAAFTSATPGRQRQSLAFSTDDGMTWTKYQGNPVVVAPPGSTDFRDPKLLWFESGSGEAWWVMAVAAGRELWFYKSLNLTAWERVSVYVPQRPWPGAIIEVPELLLVPVSGEDRAVWVLILSMHQRLSDGSIRSQVHWTAGNFDGINFVPDREGPGLPRLDFGPRFYAPLGWQTGPNDRPVIVGWMDERDRLLQAPSQPWCGRMSLPRELSLIVGADGYELLQRPMLPHGAVAGERTLEIGAASDWRKGSLPRVLRLSIGAGPSAGGVRALLVSNGDANERFELHFGESRLTLQTWGRCASDRIVIDTNEDDGLAVDIIVDKGSVEVFHNRGARVASFISGLGLDSITAGVSNSTSDSIQVRIGAIGSRTLA